MLRIDAKTMCGIVFTVIAAAQHELAAQTHLQRIQRTGTKATAAVVVRNSALLHTTQLLPLNQQQRLVADGDAERQIEQLMARLNQALAGFGVTADSMVKLNVYVSDPAVWTKFQTQFAQEFPQHQPALAVVQTRLPQGAVVGLDAVVATDRDATRVEKVKLEHSLGGARFSDAAVLPRGDAVYIAGQAARDESLATATRETLAGLRKTLEYLGLELDDVVQVKCFMRPMGEFDVVQHEVAQFFGEAMIPPVSQVEWISSLPIEIEMVAHAPAVAFQHSVSYLTPPWMSGSPVYSRVARIHGDARIYVAGLAADQAGDGAAQVRGIFHSLAQILRDAGGDLRHLAKATYYVSDDDASSKLNQLRPSFYDPTRPPAASKAAVHGVGVPGRSIIVDMIAAPKE